MSDMVDAIHANVGNIGTAVPKVAGYVTGTPDIEWTDADWARFPNSGHVRIDQGHGGLLIDGVDVYDVEAGALSPGMVPDIIRQRLAQGHQWTTLYAGHAKLQACRLALEQAGPHGWYYGHVDAWLADWNLTRAQARTLLGHELYGVTVRAVQWASPTSNPHTPVPWSSVTLGQAQVDLSVTQDDWHAVKAVTPPPDPAVKAAAQAKVCLTGAQLLAKELAGLVATLEDLA